jgi:hypothetical protein
LTGGYSAGMALPDRVGKDSVRVAPAASTSLGGGNTDIHDLVVEYGRTMESAQVLSVAGGALLLIGIPWAIADITKGLGQAMGCAYGGYDGGGTDQTGCNDGIPDPIPGLLVIAGGGLAGVGLVEFVRGWYLHHKIDRLQKARELVGFTLTPVVAPKSNTYGAVARVTF